MVWVFRLKVLVGNSKSERLPCGVWSEWEFPKLGVPYFGVTYNKDPTF